MPQRLYGRGFLQECHVDGVVFQAEFREEVTRNDTAIRLDIGKPLTFEFDKSDPALCVTFIELAKGVRAISGSLDLPQILVVACLPESEGSGIHRRRLFGRHERIEGRRTAAGKQGQSAKCQKSRYFEHR